ncbi:hypothetical protein QL285_088909 [Trifolium repens]|nr:hypothetical protein QL285_088909 [Trifolium repens]
MEKHFLGEVNPLNGSQLPRGDYSLQLRAEDVTARALFYVYSRSPRRCTSRSSPPPSLVEFLPSVGIEPCTMGISTCSIHSHYQFNW